MKSNSSSSSFCSNLVFLLVLSILFSFRIFGQNAELFTVTGENLQDGKTVALDLNLWKYRIGDETNWAARDLDESGWRNLGESEITPKELITSPEWKGRVWFRLRVKVDESAANRRLAMLVRQTGGASEVYLDGNLLTRYGEIGDDKIVEFNPNYLPIPFEFDGAGEHTFVVRFASRIYADTSSGAGRWLVTGNMLPSFSMAVKDASNLTAVINNYANSSSMRIGFLFIGILLALALLHFLFYMFYRVERANLFYSVYAASFAFFLLFNNLNSFGHFSILTTTVLSLTTRTLLAIAFVALLGFLYVAFERRLGVIFWVLSSAWAAVLVFIYITLNRFPVTYILVNILVGLFFAFSIIQLTKALRERREGAKILMAGVQIFAFAMFFNLLRSFGLINLPGNLSAIVELLVILSVPIAVSVFLARNFARTNRDLTVQLAQVEQLSQQKIEQERRAAELHAENERRAKELEEARQLQLSMLPKKLPELPNLEIAAYMKPATEVGGDYYDFHIGADGTLTIAVGDATGHGLKAGTVVTATKSLFNNLASEPDIASIFKQTSAALKKMNLRGMFMAMTMLKLKENKAVLSCAGMPSVLIYRNESQKVEEVSIRALPLGGISNFTYPQAEFQLSYGDLVVLMSDGFPEMFNEAGEIFGYDKAESVLLENKYLSPQTLINRFVEISGQWAGARPQDDDVTFVVLKIKEKTMNLNS